MGRFPGSSHHSIRRICDQLQEKGPSGIYSELSLFLEQITCAFNYKAFSIAYAHAAQL